MSSLRSCPLPLSLFSGGGHDTFLFIHRSHAKKPESRLFPYWIGNNTDDLRCSDWPKRRHPLVVSYIEIFSISSFTKNCCQKFADHLNAIWYRLQVTEATNGFTFQIINSWMESRAGLTVVPPSETSEWVWAIFAFTALFNLWNMMLQPNFLCFRHRTKSTSL